MRSLKSKCDSWWLYVLLCGDLSLYTGVTNHPIRRLWEHVDGIGCKYTKSHLPVEMRLLVFVGTRSNALKAEIWFKSLPRGEKMRMVCE